MRTDRFDDYPALRAQLAGDPHRPRYHFLPPANWMNDPNGLIHWRGQYHLFYQHNPGAAVWGDMHWGHAVSEDLLHWRDLPLALAPTPGSLDADGCWSGCTVDDGGVPTILYTAWRNQHEAVCLARGAADLLHWTKDPRNPVIAGSPLGAESAGFRDPFVWRVDDEWRMVIGAGSKGQGGAVLLYRSPDLYEWEYLGPLLTGAAFGPDEMWECPNFFALDGKYVLIYSLCGGTTVRYAVGAFDGRRFAPERWGLADGGEYFFAPLTFQDAQGRRLLFGWLEEARSEAAMSAVGWSGAMTLPRVLTLCADGSLRSAPAPEVAALRGARLENPAACHNLAQLEIEVEFESGAGPCGLELHYGAEVVRVGYAADEVFLDAGNVGCEPNIHGTCRRTALGVAQQRTEAPGASESARTLHIFLDGSVIEVFADGLSLTGRIYPQQYTGPEVRVQPYGPLQNFAAYPLEVPGTF